MFCVNRITFWGWKLGWKALCCPGSFPSAVLQNFSPVLWLLGDIFGERWMWSWRKLHLAVRSRMGTVGSELPLGHVRAEKWPLQRKKSIAKWGQHRGIPGGAEWPLGLAQLGEQERQRSEKGASLCRDQQPAHFSQGCPPRRITWKSMAQTLCSPDLQPWGWDDCS